MENDLEKLAFEWMVTSPKQAQTESKYYCPTRDIFQARVDKIVGYLIKESSIDESDAYVISAMVGEIGNNSFDHNLGKWTNVVGILFTYAFMDGKLKIILADRGQGLFATLKKVKPELIDDSEAMKTAFTERISGRAPERRGNGLKFVKENIETKKMHLTFISGNARLELNDKMEINEVSNKLHGCLAILTL